MIEAFIIIIIILILIICMLLTDERSHVAAHHNSINIDSISATRIINKKMLSGISRSIGIPTINVKFDQKIPSGIYLADSKFGNVTIFVAYNMDVGHCFFHKFITSIDSESRFDFNNLKKIVSDTNDFIITYNRGCV